MVDKRNMRTRLRGRFVAPEEPKKSGKSKGKPSVETITVTTAEGLEVTYPSTQQMPRTRPTATEMLQAILDRRGSPVPPSPASGGRPRIEELAGWVRSALVNEGVRVEAGLEMATEEVDSYIVGTPYGMTRRAHSVHLPAQHLRADDLPRLLSRMATGLACAYLTTPDMTTRIAEALIRHAPQHGEYWEGNPILDTWVYVTYRGTFVIFLLDGGAAAHYLAGFNGNGELRSRRNMPRSLRPEAPMRLMLEEMEEQRG